MAERLFSDDGVGGQPFQFARMAWTVVEPDRCHGPFLHANCGCSVADHQGHQTANAGHMAYPGHAGRVLLGCPLHQIGPVGGRRQRIDHLHERGIVACRGQKFGCFAGSDQWARGDDVHLHARFMEAFHHGREPLPPPLGELAGMVVDPWALIFGPGMSNYIKVGSELWHAGIVRDVAGSGKLRPAPEVVRRDSFPCDGGGGVLPPAKGVGRVARRGQQAGHPFGPERIKSQH